MTSIQDDIEDRIEEKLQLWVKDSFTLLEIGEVPRSEAAAIVTAQLLETVTTMVVAFTKMDPKTLAEVVATSMAAKIKKLRSSENLRS